MNNYLLEVTNVHSENPLHDQWKLLSQFSYTANIYKFFRKKGFAESQDVIEFIAGCVRQSEAYFNTYSNSPLDISPLLLYYSATNLLVGIASMLQGNKLPIRNHGMKILNSSACRIADIQVSPVDAKNGALHLLSEVFSNNCKLVDGNTWVLEEIFGSIPDLRREFEDCYPSAQPYTVAVEVVKQGSMTLERIDRKQITRFKAAKDVFDMISNFSRFYLKPQTGEDLDFIVVYRKQNVIEEMGSRSMFGRKYLELSHKKGNSLVTPNQIIVMFMGLFALGYLSRYHPERWNPFIRKDDTGEKLLIEKFLAVCARFLPNLVLGVIHNTHFQFINKVEGFLDLSTKDE